MTPPISNEDIFKLLQNIQQDNVQLKQELQNEIKGLREEISGKLQSLEIKNTVLEAENKKLKEKLNLLEKRAKKYNLIFYGERGEEWGKNGELIGEENKTAHNIIELITAKIGLNCSSKDIRDVYRIREKIADKSRPVVVEVVNYSLKNEILANAKKLKGTNIYVSHDYILEEYQDRIFLNKHLKLAREKNLNAKIKKNKLVINGEEYSSSDLRKNSVFSDESLNDLLNSTINTDSIHPQNLSPRVSSAPSTPNASGNDNFQFTKPEESKKRAAEPLTDTRPKREKSNSRRK